MSFIHTTDNATNTEPKKWTACAVPLPVCVGKKKINNGRGIRMDTQSDKRT